MRRRSKQALIALGLCVLVLAGLALAQILTAHKNSPEVGAGNAAQILTPPAKDASDQERKAYFDLVTGAAQKSSVLTLGKECAPEPLVISLVQGSSFTIKNKDTVDHTV